MSQLPRAWNSRCRLPKHISPSAPVKSRPLSLFPAFHLYPANGCSFFGSVCLSPRPAMMRLCFRDERNKPCHARPRGVSPYLSPATPAATKIHRTSVPTPLPTTDRPRRPPQETPPDRRGFPGTRKRLFSSFRSRAAACETCSSKCFINLQFLS